MQKDLQQDLLPCRRFGRTGGLALSVRMAAVEKRPAGIIISIIIIIIIIIITTTTISIIRANSYCGY